MKNKALLIILSIITVSGTCFYLLNQPKQPVIVPKDAFSAGIRGKQNDRQHRDWQMLHDPATGKIPAGMRGKELAFAKTLPTGSHYRTGSSSKTTSGQDFVLQGPYNVGGRTRAMAIDVSNENILLAGSVSGGLYRSINGGSTWTKVTAADQYLGVTAIAQDKRTGHTNTWYYSSGEGYGTSASGDGAFYLGDGLFKSTDGGLNWNPVSSTANGSHQSFTTNWQVVWNIATHPNDTADLVFAATYDAIYKSVDGGDSWSAALTSGVSGADSYFADVAVTNDGVVYATLSSDGSKRGIWRSANGIDAFVNITPDNFFNGTDTIHWPGVYDRTVIGIDPNDEDVVYFFSHSPGFGIAAVDFSGDTNWVSLWKYEYLSGDGDTTGGFWTDLSQNLPVSGTTMDRINLQGSYNMKVSVMPGNSDVVFIGGTNIYRSTDGFTSPGNTTQVGGYGIGSTLPFYTSYNNHHSDQHGMVFLPSDPSVMISATDGGLYKTTDCLAGTVQWTSLNNGYLTSQFYTIAVDHGTQGSNVVTGGLQDWGSWWTNSDDQLYEWKHVSHGDGSHCAVADGGGAYYFSRQQGRLMKATVDNNGDVTAFRRFDPIGPTKNDYQFINPFVLDPVDNNVLYLAQKSNLWRNDSLSSINLDGSWDTISTGWMKYSWRLPDTTMEINALAVSTTPAHRLYIGTDKKKIYKISNANTGDPVAVDITANTMPSSGYVSGIAVDPRDADKVMVVFSNYKIYSIFYSENGGSSWIKVAGNLEQNSSGSGNGPSVRCARIIPTNDGTVYLVGTSVGLFATDSMIADSTVWIQQGANSIGNVVVTAIDSRTTDGFVAIATHGNGVYTTNYTSVSEIAGISPQSMVDNQWSVYPNPARDNTTIEVELNKNSNVSLVIYDEMGRMIKTVLNKEMPKGKHQIPVSVSGLSAGIYYCSLVADKSRQSKTLVVAR